MTRTGRPAPPSATGLPPTSSVTSDTPAPTACRAAGTARTTAPTSRSRRSQRTIVIVGIVTAAFAFSAAPVPAVSAPAVAATWPGDTRSPGNTPTLSVLAGGPVGGTPAGVALSGRPTSTDALVAPTEGSWPLSPAPTVVRDFEAPAARWAAGHRGVDLAGRPGQQVRAAVAGTVSFAGRIAGRGVVVVSHGASRTTYEPVAASVSVWDEVNRGDPIGTLELLGSHCLPHACLHWGLLEGETYLDPLRLLGPAPVRLLPWSGALP